MKKVEFVNFKSELSGYGLGKGSKYTFSGVENIIKDRIGHQRLIGYRSFVFLCPQRQRKKQNGAKNNHHYSLVLIHFLYSLFIL